MKRFTWLPDQGPSEKVTTAVDKCQFAEGYSQRVPLGINNVVQHWSYNFTLRTKAEIMAIRAFLKGCKGAESFELPNVYGEMIIVVSDEWSTNVNHDGDSSASVTFDQVFEA